jgi:hypothetical protein
VTTTPMNHDEARELLAGLALDSIEAADEARVLARVLAHVATCQACAAELKELRDAAAAIPVAAELRSQDNAGRAARVKGRLMARVRESKNTTVVPTAAAKTGRGASFGNRAAIAAGILCIASAGFSAMLWHDRSDLRNAIASIRGREAISTRSADSLRSALTERDKIIAGLTGRDMAMVRLTSNAKRETWALMFWNRETNAWTFVAHSLPPLAKGRTYQLWLVTANAKISAGTFAPSGNGEAVVSAVYALGRDALKAVAVTEEPEGGVAQPTGAVVVVGAEGGAGR